jgi:hypothetical protein
LTGQASRIQVETPKRGRSHACTKIHTARIKMKINVSFIFLPFFKGEVGFRLPLSPLIQIFTQQFCKLIFG